MFFYALFVPVMIFLAWQIHVLRNMKKHDIHLHRFCDLRREAIRLMFERRDAMSPEEYAALRRLVGILNTVIANYRLHRFKLFDLRAFRRYLAGMKQASNSVNRIATPTKEIKDIHDRLAACILDSFFAFTPMIESDSFTKIVRKIAVGFLRSTQLLKIPAVKRFYSLLTNAFEFAKEQSERANRDLCHP